MDTLTQIAEVVELRNRTKTATVVLRREWDTYIFFAQHREGYSEFVIQELSKGIRYKYFSRPRFNIEYAKTEDYTFSQGSQLIGHLIREERRYEETRKTLSYLMKHAWIDEEIPLKDIREAYGQSENTTYAYIAKQPWFKKRYKETA